MSITVSDAPDIVSQAEKLGCSVPRGICIVPRNFFEATSRENLLHESSAATVRILFRQEAIAEDTLERPSERFLCAQENAFEWLGPTICFTALSISQNPMIIAVSLNVIGNYLTDWFRGIAGEKKVKLDIIVEKQAGRSYKRIHYEGTPDGLKELGEIAREVINNEQRN